MIGDEPHAAFDGVAGLYALGALDAADRAAFEEHLEECRSCVDEVMTLLPVAHVLTRAVPYFAPAPGLRGRVIQAVTGAPPPDEIDDLPLRAPAAPPAPTRRGGRLGRLLFNLVALVCLVAAGGLGWYAAEQVNLARALQEGLDAANQRATLAELDAVAARDAAARTSGRADVLAAPDLSTITLAGQPAAPEARAHVFWSGTRGVVVMATGLPPVPAGSTYQLWFVPDASPISGGLLVADDAGRVSASVAPPDGVSAPTPMAVTLEPDGGRAAPSGEVFLLGRPAG